MKLKIVKRVIKEGQRIKKAKQTGILKMGEGRKSKDKQYNHDTPWASSW